jgi:hypothetical protein
MAGKKERAMKRLIMILALCQGAGMALAQSAPQAAATASASATAAEFRCGGVGQEDQQRMKSDAGRHDLMLTFATSTGAYLADIDFEISSGDKVVLQGRCNGPLMLVDLPADGSYQVRASANGKEQRKVVSIGGKPATATFVWPAS